MEKNFVLSGNKLIAEFMGYEYIPFNNDRGLKPGWWKNIGTDEFKQRIQIKEPVFRKVGKSTFLARNHMKLRYYNEWDWLMPVIKKIQELNKEILLSSKRKYVPFIYINQIECTFHGRVDIKETYSSVLSWIKYYNQHINE